MILASLNYAKLNRRSADEDAIRFRKFLHLCRCSACVRGKSQAAAASGRLLTQLGPDDLCHAHMPAEGFLAQLFMQILGEVHGRADHNCIIAYMCRGSMDGSLVIW